MYWFCHHDVTVRFTFAFIAKYELDKEKSIDIIIQIKS